MSGAPNGKHIVFDGPAVRERLLRIVEDVIIALPPAHCQAKVEKALKSVSGVYSAVIDLPDGAVQHAGHDARLAG